MKKVEKVCAFPTILSFPIIWKTQNDKKKNSPFKGSMKGEEKESKTVTQI